MPINAWIDIEVVWLTMILTKRKFPINQPSSSSKPCPNGVGVGKMSNE